MKTDIMHEAMSLSSGTMSKLTGNSDYASIEKVQRKFVQFVISTFGSFKDWKEAWKQFSKVRNIKTGEIKDEYFKQ